MEQEAADPMRAPSAVDLLVLNELTTAQKLQLDVLNLRETMDDPTADLDVGERVELEKNHAHVVCLEARTVLMIPFSFDNLDSQKQESPLEIESDLKHRTVGGEPMWESDELPEEASEFREHFQKLMGGGGSDKSLLRLRMPDQTRINLTQGARVWVSEKGQKKKLLERFFEGFVKKRFSRPISILLGNGVIGQRSHW